MKTSPCQLLLAVFAALLLPVAAASAQVNSGSDGRDGAFNPTQSVTVDMADHPDGIYQFTSVNIPSGVTVTFKPNARNTPVVWLVQGDCVINGIIDLHGASSTSEGGLAGAGGYRGGSAGGGAIIGSPGQGPGGGAGGTWDHILGGNASYASQGNVNNYYPSAAPGVVYGNPFLIPLLGGAGGGGAYRPGGDPVSGGGGGGGGLLIASSQNINLAGKILSFGGNGKSSTDFGYFGGGGSGGAVRFVASSISGGGAIEALGGYDSSYYWDQGVRAGSGRVRFDTYQNSFGGSVNAVFTQGFQPIIIPASGQGIQLAIQSLAGVVVATSSGALANPDVIIPAQQVNPIPIVVHCTNLPLNTQISVVVHPANGPDVQATGTNNSGSAASSTATIPVNLPRGGGIIYAKAVSGIAGMAAASPAGGNHDTRSLAETGWTAEGERFATVEVTAALGGPSQVAYVTESGKRFTLPAP